MLEERGEMASRGQTRSKGKEGEVRGRKVHTRVGESIQEVH